MIPAPGTGYLPVMQPTARWCRRAAPLTAALALFAAPPEATGQG